MIGDTPDDCHSATQAGVLPLASPPPGGRGSGGGAWVLGQTHDAPRAPAYETDCPPLSECTKETTVNVTLTLDGTGKARGEYGHRFLDHLIDTLARHRGLRLDALSCKGRPEFDDHHSAEDCALVLGEALDRALGERRGIVRFGVVRFRAARLRRLARAVVDLSGRPYSAVDLGLRREAIGGLACENVAHVLRSLAVAARLTLHVDVLRGRERPPPCGGRI